MKANGKSGVFASALPIHRWRSGKGASYDMGDRHYLKGIINHLFTYTKFLPIWRVV